MGPATTAKRGRPATASPNEVFQTVRRQYLDGTRVDLTVVARSLGLGRATIYRWFGYDEANYTTMPYGKELLGELHDLSPMPVYIRTHHLLTSGDGKAELKFSSTNVYSEDANGKQIYDFKIHDGIFDAYQAAGVRPMARNFAIDPSPPMALRKS